MQVVAFIFFTAALFLALAVVGQMLFAYRFRILEVLAGVEHQAETGPGAEIIYLQPRVYPEVEWRKAA